MPKRIVDTAESFRLSTIEVLNHYIKPTLGGIFKPKFNDDLYAEKLRLATLLRDQLQSKNPPMNQVKIMQAVADLIYENKEAVIEATKKSGIKNIIIGGADEKLPHDEIDNTEIVEVPSRFVYNTYYGYGDLHKYLTSHLEALKQVHPNAPLLEKPDPELPVPTQVQVDGVKMTRGQR